MTTPSNENLKKLDSTTVGVDAVAGILVTSDEIKLTGKTGLGDAFSNIIAVLSETPAVEFYHAKTVRLMIYMSSAISFWIGNRMGANYVAKAAGAQLPSRMFFLGAPNFQINTQG